MSSQSAIAIKHGRRARNALWASFLLMGAVSMGWVPRIPEIKDAIGLSNSQFGFLLLGATLGSITGAQLGGRVTHHFGSRRVVSYAIVLMPLGLATMAIANSALLLFLGLFLMGFGYSSMDIAYNFQATVVEKILERRWMSTFHAMWSVGAFLTTVLGGAIARHVSPRTNLLIIALVCLIAFIPAAYFLLSPERDDHSVDESHEGKIPLFGKKVMPLWWIGIGLLGALIAEGAASDWGAILLRDEMGFDKGVNATAFASFSLAMITSRFLGDRTLDRLGPAKTVRLSGYIGGFGWGAALLIAVPLSQSHPAIALVVINLGFICAGYGIGPMFPAFIVAASKTPGVSPAVAMARVGVIGLAGFFIGPTLIGLLSDVFTLQIAMLYPVVALLFAGFLSRTIHVK